MAYTFLSLWNDYGIISVLVVLASVGIVAIVYMIGRAIANEKMMAWATDEFYQAFASLLIIALVLFLFGFFTKFVLQLLNVADFQCSPFAGTCTYTEYRMRQTVLVAGEMYTITRECGAAGNACHIAIAQSKVNSMFDLVRFVAVEKVMRGGLLRNLKSFNIRMKEQWSGILGMFSKFAKVKFAPFVGVSTLIDTYGMVIDRLTNLLKFLMVHSAFFTLIEKVVFPIFLVIGITLRAFFPLRKIGGLLIATAVALYFVYPLLFILQSMILSPDPDKFPITFEEFKENTEV
ncbi:MAG: hypothetical protein QW112_02895, partial [Candidatus Micrarchaeia archaeon]